MGCDIHLVLEIKDDLGKWIGVNQFTGRLSSEKKWCSWPCTDRDYQRFALLAGVRGTGPVPKGMPDDISETAAYLAYKWAGDGHSHSWISLKEAMAIWETTSNTTHEYPSDYWFGVDEDEVEKHRLVFWFDN